MSLVEPSGVIVQLDLSAEQKHRVLTTATELIAATVCGRPARLHDATMGGVAEKPVSGVFVSLKRRRHLRSCCGGLRGQPITLGEALSDAVVRTVHEDVRFPPVSPTELAYLDMEVWILFNPQPVQARGEERAEVIITGGKHGIIINRGQNHGLLLPGVAEEHGWGSRKFLEQTCVKAGIHPSLWKDDATRVFTFEGQALRGPLAEFSAESLSYVVPPWLTTKDLSAYADFCRQNILAMLTGATPRYSIPDVPDGNVTGVALTLRVPPAKGKKKAAPVAQPLKFFQLSLRPGVALQATLFQLTQSAAARVGGLPLNDQDSQNLTAGVTVFYDPSMHGTAANPHLQGVTGTRAVMVMERSRTAIVFDRAQMAEEILGTAAEQARVNTPASAAVFSLEVASTETALSVTTAPEPVAGSLVRAPGVAGRFYPGEASGLSRLVDKLLSSSPPAIPEPWPAAMVPHAGLVFSGRIAAGVLKRLKIPKTVIIIGPKHTPHGMDWAVAPHETWSLPGFTLQSDVALARKLARAIPGLALDALAHQQEHAVEVELPLIATLAPQTQVVGIAIGHGDLESCKQFAAGLVQVLRKMKEKPLLLVSSDMNHFATDEENRRLDELALSALDTLDPDQVYQTVTENNISMCGVLPAVIVLETLRQLDSLTKAERVGYATSAEVTGDPSRVVGYAGMLFG